MNRSITGRHFELTDAIKAYANALIDGLSKYNLDIISANIVIVADEKHGKKGFKVEIIVNLKDKNTIVITQRDKDVYAALDLGMDRIKKSLRRHANKIKDHKVMSFADLGAEAEAVNELEADEIEIVPGVRVEKPGGRVEYVPLQTKVASLRFGDLEVKEAKDTISSPFEYINGITYILYYLGSFRFDIFNLKDIYVLAKFSWQILYACHGIPDFMPHDHV